MTKEDPWLDRDQLETWVAISALLECLPSAINTQLKNDAGINLFEYTLLAMLSEQDEHSLVMTDLADLAMGSLSRLSHAISRLETRGWVERKAGTGGRRHNRVHLTAEGLEATAQAAPLHVANVRRLLIDPLSEQELRSLLTISRKVLEAVDPEIAYRVGELTPQIVSQNLKPT